METESQGYASRVAAWSGKGTWRFEMKKSSRRLTFAATIAGAAVAAALTACHETVYGPPETPAGETYDPASEVPESVYGPPPEEAAEDADTSGFAVEDLYGPPVELETEEITEEQEESAEEGVTSLTAKPAEPERETIPAGLYGPPPADLERYDPAQEIP